MNVPFSEIEAFASKFYPGQKLLITPYGYTATFLALAQNATQTQQVNISAQGDFMLLGFNHRAQIGAAQTTATKTAPFVRLLVTDNGSNEQYTSGAVDLENYSANTLVDHTMPYPRIIPGRSSLSLQATNYSPGAGETYTTLDVYMEGVLVRAYNG